MNIFQPFVAFMKDVIHAIYELTVTVGFPSYALAIIILGVIVRVLLLPLSIKQMKSMLGMSEIQPELAQLQKQYANNREKLAQEMNRLYEEYDVHPMAGCLPMLIQMPILYALFRAMREYNFQENASFLWIQSLNNTDNLFILPVVLGVVMFIQQRLSMPKGSGMDSNPTMKMMLYVMPVMMAFMGLQFPSGLCLYWITTSALMVFQQLYMNRLRKKEMAKRAEARAERMAQREEEQKQRVKQGQNPSKRKSKQQLKNEHKAKKRELNTQNAEYKAPSKKGGGATYHPPKSGK